MAINRFDTKGFGQIEPNQVWFTRAGKSESQVALDPTVFAANFPKLATEEGLAYAENGQFLAVDKAKGIATYPTAETDSRGCPVGIHYSTERLLNEYTPGRRNFALVRNEFLPRIGFTDVGERFTINAVSWDDAVYSAATSDDLYAAVKTAIAGGEDVFAVVTEESKGQLLIGGAIDSALGGIYTKVVKAYTNADGTKAFMFQVINKPTV